MKILASSTLLFDYPMTEVFQIAKELEYDGVEVWHFHLVKTGEDENAEQLKSLAQDLGLSLSFHALSWDLNFTSKLKRIREASLEMLQESISIAAAMGANPVVIHPGRITIPDDSADASWQLLEEGVSRLVSWADSLELDVAMEIMEHIPKEFFITPEDGNRLLQEVPGKNLGITFDAAHVPLEIDPLEYLKRVNRVMHVHLSDLTPQKRHIALGTGVRDYQDLVQYTLQNLDADIAIEGMENKHSRWLIEHNKKEITSLLSKISV